MPGQLSVETILIPNIQASAPAAPTANQAIFYTTLDSTGNTILSVKFTNGMTQMIGTSSGAGVNANGLILLGATSGSITLIPTAIAGATTITLPATNGTIALVSTANVISVAGRSGVVTLSSNDISGTATSDVATAGKIGELLIVTVGSGAALTLSTGVVKEIANLTLTAGDWDVSGFVGFVTGTGTATTLLAGNFSTVSAQSPSADGGARFPVNLTWSNGEGIIFTLAPQQVNLTGSTVYYLNAIANFSVSSLKGYGILRARRMR